MRKYLQGAVVLAICLIIFVLILNITGIPFPRDEVNGNNFDLVKDGMTVQQVQSILGVETEIAIATEHTVLVPRGATRVFHWYGRKGFIEVGFDDRGLSKGKRFTEFDRTRRS